ncbi:MAG: methyltransferase domain-containing protein [Polyangiaceae bacterium]|nr:methyltransferase domain-containing protein [Polyangiaceae bacterium]
MSDGNSSPARADGEDARSSEGASEDVSGEKSLETEAAQLSDDQSSSKHVLSGSEELQSNDSSSEDRSEEHESVPITSEVKSADEVESTPDVESEPPPEIETHEASLSELESEFSDSVELREELAEQAPEPEEPNLEQQALSDEFSVEELAEEALEANDELEEAALLEELTPEPLAVAPREPSRPPELPDRKPPPPKRSVKPRLPEQPKRKPWWETLFGDDFARAYRPLVQGQLKAETDFVESQLGLERGDVILDLGCGQGELCGELTRRGYSGVGYDLSVFQLAMAAELAQDQEQKINFLQGDMREMAFDQMFNGLICWGTSFGYFEEEKNIDVARRMFSALKPGGTLMIDVMNRDFAAKESPGCLWFEGDGCVCMDDTEVDWITSRLRVKRSLILDDGRSKELFYSLRLYSLSEIGKLLHSVGFKVSSISGDVSTVGAFFGPNSPRIIINAQRPA